MSKTRPVSPELIARRMSSLSDSVGRGNRRAPSLRPMSTSVTGMVTLTFWRRVPRSVTSTRSERGRPPAGGRALATSASIVSSRRPASSAVICLFSTSFKMRSRSSASVIGIPLRL
jgi:hypothetical protein